VKQCNIKWSRSLFKRRPISSTFYARVYRMKIWRQISYKKCARKTLMKLAPAVDLRIHIFWAVFGLIAAFFWRKEFKNCLWFFSNIWTENFGVIVFNRIPKSDVTTVLYTKKCPQTFYWFFYPNMLKYYSLSFCYVDHNLILWLAGKISAYCGLKKFGNPCCRRSRVNFINILCANF